MDGIVLCLIRKTGHQLLSPVMSILVIVIQLIPSMTVVSINMVIVTALTEIMLTIGGFVVTGTVNTMEIFVVAVGGIKARKVLLLKEGSLTDEIIVVKVLRMKT